MQTHTKGPSVTYDNFLTIISVFIIMLTLLLVFLLLCLLLPESEQMYTYQTNTTIY